jgi:hypothetical protein
MELGIILFTLGAYGLSVYLGWQERTPHYLVALVAGHLAALPSPLWQMLYGFRYAPSLATVYALERDGMTYALPWVALIGAWTLMLPPLAIFYLQRRGWWFSGYVSGLMTFAMFVLYHMLVETIGTRAGWWGYAEGGQLPFGLSQMMLAALMQGLVSLGALAALVLTRHYALGSLLGFLLPVPLLLSLLVHGLLGAPLYTVLLLRAQSWAGVIGMAGTLGLVLWAAHIVASGLAQQRTAAS